MSIHVYSPVELAEILGVSEVKVMEWRRTYGWPSIKVGRTVRFTQEQVEQILASHSVKKSETPEIVPVIASGQTARSANRRRSA